MKKFLYFMLFYFILSVGICAGIYFLCTSDKVQEFFQEEEVKRELRQKNADFQKRQEKAQRELRQKNADFQKRQEKAQRKLRQKNATQEQVQANPQQELEKKIADFESRHKELASLPPRSFKEGYQDHSLYPDDYYDKTQQLYREEIAFIVEQYGEEATAKVVFLISQIPVTGQYFIGKIETDGLRCGYAHNIYPVAFDAVCAQIAHKTINSICDYALGLAMGYGYKQMAQSIIRCYKPDILITRTKVNSGWGPDEYKVSTTYQSRDNAKARIADL